MKQENAVNVVAEDQSLGSWFEGQSEYDLVTFEMTLPRKADDSLPDVEVNAIVTFHGLKAEPMALLVVEGIDSVEYNRMASIDRVYTCIEDIHTELGFQIPEGEDLLYFDAVGKEIIAARWSVEKGEFSARLNHLSKFLVGPGMSERDYDTWEAPYEYPEYAELIMTSLSDKEGVTA